MKQYLELLKTIKEKGTYKPAAREGMPGTQSLFGYQFRHNLQDGFPLLTTKKMYWKGIVTELLWFLKGDTNIKYLVDNDCHIWNGDALKVYNKHEMDEFKKLKEKYPNRRYKFALTTQEHFTNKIKTDDEFAKKWGELGPIYGKQWRNWGGELITKRIKEEGKFPVSQNVMGGQIDQIQNLINDLKTNPDSRRLLVTAWNPAEIDAAVLPPCHIGFQVYTRELSDGERWNLYCETLNGLKTPSIKGSTKKETMDSYYQEYNIPTRAISLKWQQRSVDSFLGLPFNIASYGLLLEIIAKEVNMVPDELIGDLGDTHLYLNHIEQAKEQIGRTLTHQERSDLKNQGGYGKPANNKLIDERLLDSNNVPKRTREPFPLPKLVHMKTDAFYKSLSEEPSLYGHLDTKDFQLENYRAHPGIKAPLSN